MRQISRRDGIKKEKNQSRKRDSLSGRRNPNAATLRGAVHSGELQEKVAEYIVNKCLPRESVRLCSASETLRSLWDQCLLHSKVIRLLGHACRAHETRA